MGVSKVSMKGMEVLETGNNTIMDEFSFFKLK